MALPGRGRGCVYGLQSGVSVGREDSGGPDARLQVDVGVPLEPVLVHVGQELQHVAALVELGGFLGAFLGIFGRAGTLRGYPRRSAFWVSRNAFDASHVQITILLPFQIDGGRGSQGKEVCRQDMKKGDVRTPEADIDEGILVPHIGGLYRRFESAERR